MEVDVVGVDAVDAALRDGEAPEDRLRAVVRAWRQPGGGELVADRPPAAVRLGVRRRCGNARRPDPVPDGALHVQLEPVDAQAVEPGADGVERRAGVDQRGEQHVAREAADGVDVEQARHAGSATVSRSRADERAMRAAIVPAPSPSSIPTTARPAAHEVAIDSRAVRPPNAAP